MLQSQKIEEKSVFNEMDKISPVDFKLEYHVFFGHCQKRGCWQEFYTLNTVKGCSDCLPLNPLNKYAIDNLRYFES